MKRGAILWRLAPLFLLAGAACSTVDQQQPEVLTACCCGAPEHDVLGCTAVCCRDGTPCANPLCTCAEPTRARATERPAGK